MTGWLLVLAAIRWVGILGAAAYLAVAAIAWDPGWLVVAALFALGYVLATYAFGGLARHGRNHP